MIIKLEKVISCTSEHPSYPASNLLQQKTNSSWRCAKPGQLLASVIFQLAEPSTITGVDIGNYRCCDVVITASTSDEPDNWIPVVNHRFMSHDEAANGKFRDQVELFTKKELNADTIKIKFTRAKVTCLQSANLRELFGLSFVVLRTQVTLDLGADIFGRFKLKDPAKEISAKRAPDKPADYRESLAEEIKKDAARNFAKRQENPAKLAKRPILEKIKAREEAEENESSCPAARTPFGDVINSHPQDRAEAKKKAPGAKNEEISDRKMRKVKKTAASDCRECEDDRSPDSVCKKCGKPPPPPDKIESPPAKKPKIAEKPSKRFGDLFNDVTFALSGYVNPQRDQIRRKALKMGGKYVADPNTTDNKCSHLVCAFKNTPKFRQLEGHAKIVSRSFVEECFRKKKRLPWRRFALDSKESKEPESEEEIEASTTPAKPPDPYQLDTDVDSDY